MCSIGGRRGNSDASRSGAIVEIPLFPVLGSNPSRRGQCLVGSLAGAAAS